MVNLRDEQNVDSSDEFEGFEVKGIFRMPFTDTGTVRAEVEVNEFHGGQLTFTGFRRNDEEQEFTAGLSHNGLHGLGLMLIEAADRIEKNRREEAVAKFERCLAGVDCADAAKRARAAHELRDEVECLMTANGPDANFKRMCQSVARLQARAGGFMQPVFGDLFDTGSMVKVRKYDEFYDTLREMFEWMNAPVHGSGVWAEYAASKGETTQAITKPPLGKLAFMRCTPAEPGTDPHGDSDDGPCDNAGSQDDYVEMRPLQGDRHTVLNMGEGLHLMISLSVIDFTGKRQVIMVNLATGKVATIHYCASVEAVPRYYDLIKTCRFASCRSVNQPK